MDAKQRRSARRFAALLMATAGCSVACRDLKFSGGRRISDDHVLAGRSSAAGGDSMTALERSRKWFSSTTVDLSRLQADLRAHIGLRISLKSTMAALPDGEVTYRDPRVSSPTLLTTTATLGSPSVPPVNFEEVIRFVKPDPEKDPSELPPKGELQRLCEHPLLGSKIPKCKLDLGFEKVPFDDLDITLDSANIGVTWSAPRQVVRTLRPTDDPGNCGNNDDGGIKNECSTGFVCPKDDMGAEQTGTCEFDRPCTVDADCLDPECAAWGGCTDPATGASAGTCDTVAGECSAYIEHFSGESDPIPDVPTLRVLLPFDLDLDPDDFLGSLIDIDLRQWVLELRLQPKLCTGGACKTYGGEMFENYVGSNDVRFSVAGVDVVAQSQTWSRDYEVIPTGCIFAPDVLLAGLFPPPPGSVPFTCGYISGEVIPPLLDKAFDKGGKSVGSVFSLLTAPPRLTLPTGGLPSWLSITPANAFFRTPSSGPVTARRLVALGSSHGGWTDGTIDILAKGGDFSHLDLDLSGSPLPALCNSGSTTLPDGTCTSLCGGAPTCSFRSARVCLRFGGGSVPCPGGLTLNSTDFRILLGQTTSLTGPEITAIIANIRDATAPIPAVPHLATLFDAAPQIARTIQSVFTKPLEDAYGDGAYYTDIVNCPATGPRPAACPTGSVGPVFRFEVDADRDGIPDDEDACPLDPSTGNVNTDGDRWCDDHDLCIWTPSEYNTAAMCDCDRDNDGCNNPLPATPIAGAPSSVPTECAKGANGIYDQRPGLSDNGSDIDNDSVSDDCDVDDDGDLVNDSSDNCPVDYNPAQTDTNNDGWGDACDPLCMGPGSPCPEVDQGRRFGVIDFDFGAKLAGACLNDGPGCFGFFRFACAGYGASGSECLGGGIADRIESGVPHLVYQLGPELPAALSLGDVTGDGVAELLLAGGDGTITAIDGGKSSVLWHVAGGASFGASLALGDGFIAVGEPDFSGKFKSGQQGAVHLLSLQTGKPWVKPIEGTTPGARLGASLSYDRGFLYMSAPGVASQGQPKLSSKLNMKSAGRVYVLTSFNHAPKLVLSGGKYAAAIGHTAPAFMTYQGVDAVVLAAPGTASRVRARWRCYRQAARRVRREAGLGAGQLDIANGRLRR